MRVESRIDRVNRIEIITKLKIIDVEALEELQIRGYDEQGNSFSSLEGMRFVWTIIQKEPILEFVSLKETAIKSSELRKELEGKDFMTDMVVIKGLKTGTAEIRVVIKEKGYENVKAFINKVRFNHLLSI
jgi:nuclear pore complex protein Nup210